MGLGLAPSSYPGDHGDWWVSPSDIVWFGAIPSGERFVWTREQQSKAPCGLGSSGNESGSEGALPGVVRESEMAPGSASDPRAWPLGQAKLDVEQEQDMVGQCKQQGVQESTATLVAPVLSSPQVGIVFFTCPTWLD